MGKVCDVMGDYRFDIDCSTCMVAIALYRHRVVVENVNTQISVEHLTAEVNLLPLSKCPNLNAYSLSFSLKHGFLIVFPPPEISLFLEILCVAIVLP
jgi:hypothetical protein